MNKKYKIQFTSKAKSDYYNILDYSFEISFNYYIKIIKSFKSKIQNLLKYPFIYPKVLSTREFRKVIIDNNYVLIYKIYGNIIIVERIFSKRINYIKYI